MAVIGLDVEAADANQAYGALRESLFLAGFTLERAFQTHLEPLIDGDAWRKCGPGFDDINVFMDSLRLDKFRVIADDRKRIVKRIQQLQPKVTKRQIARTLGVDEGTIRNDVAEDSAVASETTKKISVPETASAEYSARSLTGEEAAKRITRFEEAPSRRAARREERLKRIVDANPPWPAGRRWPVIYGDPPWRWETWSRETGLDRAPEAHYDTMALDAIKAIDVPSIAAEDAVSFLWATAPILPQALEVMAAWGFAYKTHLVWAKDRAGTGYWLRNKHELLLIGTRGQIPAPLPGRQGESIIEASVGAHSEKPAVFVELIESWYPDVPKIELFCRGKPRLGWDGWGNEVLIAAEVAE